MPLGGIVIGPQRSSGGVGGATPTSDGGSSSGISKADIGNILKTFQATTSKPSTVSQPPPTVSTNTQANPLLSQSYQDYGAERQSLAGNVDQMAQLAMARGQQAADRAQEQAVLGAAQRGASPESGVSRLLGAKAQMQGLQSQQGLNADLANQGRMQSANLLAGQSGAASNIAANQLAAQQAAQANTQYAQNMAFQMAEAERAAQQAAQQQQFQLATLLGSLFSG